MERRRQPMTLVLAGLLLASACGGPGPSGPGASTGPSPSAGAATSPGGSGDAALAGAALAEAASASDEAGLESVEAAVAREGYAVARLLERLGGSEMLARIMDARRSAGGEALAGLLGSPGGSPSPGAATDPLAGRMANAGDAPSRLALSGLDASGNLALTGTLVGELMTQVPPSTQGSRGSTSSSSANRATTSTGTTGNVTIQDTLEWVSNGSTLSGSADVTTTIEILDGNGNVVETVTTTSHGVVEVDRCPAADGSVNGDYELDYQTTSTAGGGSTYHISGRVVGTVLDEAFLHSYAVDSSGSVQNGAGVDRAVTVQGAWDLSTAGDTGSGQLTSENGSVVRADPAATTGDLVHLGGNATAPGIFIAISLFRKAQDQWRNGACVAVESSVADRNVEPDEQVQLTATVKHKIEGTSLQVPVRATLTGVRSVTPLDVDVRAPADFTFTASSQPGDTGTVHLVSTSRRGIGKLDVRFLVVPKLVLELVIDSTINFTMYGTFGSDAEAHVKGTIRLEQDDKTGLWSGHGVLHSTTASSIGGCQTITIVGQGDYDWIVRQVRASRGLPTSELRVWMDAGPIAESFDDYTVRYCPAGAFTGTVNTWENAFFILARAFYGQNGLLVDNFDDLGVDTSRWYHGLELGSAEWVLPCATIAAMQQVHTDCTGGAHFKLRVVDPNQPAPPP